jgi:hypothetical protein
VAVAVERLDAVVFIRVVGSCDGKPRVGAFPREDGDRGRGDKARQQHIRAGGCNPRGQCHFQHIAGNARVLPYIDDRLMMQLFGQHRRRRLPDRKRLLGR